MTQPEEPRRPDRWRTVAVVLAVLTAGAVAAGLLWSRTLEDRGGTASRIPAPEAIAAVADCDDLAERAAGYLVGLVRHFDGGTVEDVLPGTDNRTDPLFVRDSATWTRAAAFSSAVAARARELGCEQAVLEPHVHEPELAAAARTAAGRLYVARITAGSDGLLLPHLDGALLLTAAAEAAHHDRLGVYTDDAAQLRPASLAMQLIHAEVDVAILAADQDGFCLRGSAGGLPALYLAGPGGVITAESCAPAD